MENHPRGGSDTMTDRHDSRYLDHDSPRARLRAYWGDLEMGGWGDDNQEDFRGAVADLLLNDLDSCAASYEIADDDDDCPDILIEEVAP
jgi:hypothetical protein